MFFANEVHHLQEKVYYWSIRYLNSRSTRHVRLVVLRSLPLHFFLFPNCLKWLLLYIFAADMDP